MLYYRLSKQPNNAMMRTFRILYMLMIARVWRL